MEPMNIFEQATRKKLRFASEKGLLSVEDLWDLPLTSTRGASLNNLAIGLNRQIKELPTTSFIDDAVAKSVPDDLQLAFDIVLHVIDSKKKERDAAILLAARKEKRQKLLDILSRKENQQLEGSSVEDIRKMLEDLG